MTNREPQLPTRDIACALYFPTSWEEMLRAKLAPWELVRCPQCDDPPDPETGIEFHGYIIGVPTKGSPDVYIG